MVDELGKCKCFDTMLDTMGNAMFDEMGKCNVLTQCLIQRLVRCSMQWLMKMVEEMIQAPPRQRESFGVKSATNPYQGTPPAQPLYSAAD